MSVQWVVRFCTSCFGAFDVEDTGKRLPELCPECKAGRHAEYKRRRRAAYVPRPRARAPRQSPEQKREIARMRKAEWRERTGRH